MSHTKRTAQSQVRNKDTVHFYFIVARPAAELEDCARQEDVLINA